MTGLLRQVTQFQCLPVWQVLRSPTSASWGFLRASSRASPSPLPPELLQGAPIPGSPSPLCWPEMLLCLWREWVCDCLLQMYGGELGPLAYASADFPLWCPFLPLFLHFPGDFIYLFTFSWLFLESTNLCSRFSPVIFHSSQSSCQASQKCPWTLQNPASTHCLSTHECGP